MSMSQYKWPLYYSGDGESSEFLNVLPKKLTLQFPDRCWKNKKYSTQTIFKEVITKGHHLNKPAKEIIALPHKKSTFKKLYESIKQAIYKNWDPNKTHFIGHSSGYDSRVLSTAINELREQHGDNWYGNTIYVELLEESPEFKLIMKRQNIDNYYIYDPINSYCFKTFFEKYNGIIGYPHNVWYDGYKHLEKEGYFSLENSQLFSGYGSNNIDICIERGKPLESYFLGTTKYQEQFLRTFTRDTIFPFWDYGVINNKAGIETKKEERITRRLARVVAPHLEDIPALGNSQQTISRGQNRNHSFIRIKQWYNNSWYGKQNPFNGELRYYEYHPFWVHYATASLCEYLLERGYRIRQS